MALLSQRAGNKEIYVKNLDGTRPGRLPNNAAPDTFLSWSKDGLHIIFSSLRDDVAKAQNWQLYVMNADGTHLKSLTGDLSTSYSYARWSPNGTRVAVTEVHYRPDGPGTGGMKILSLLGAVN